jgi:hypothetical protein
MVIISKEEKNQTEVMKNEKNKKHPNRERKRTGNNVDARMSKHGRHSVEVKASVRGNHRTNAGSGDGRVIGI